MTTMKTVGVSVCAVLLWGGVWAQTPVLTYNGATKGDWFAPGVWLNESGASVNWQDGARAVITNREVTLTADAVVYGLQVCMTGRYCVYGSGKLTLGAGGIAKTGAGEFNIQCAGGLYLSASQAWSDPNGGMVCLDGLHALTAADGVTLTGNSATLLRMNAGGGLGSNTTVRVTENAFLSLSPDGSMGHSVIVLDGSGNRLVSDSGFVFADSRLGSQLILRNGASVASGACAFGLGTITVDAPSVQAVSTIAGTSWTLTQAATVFDVASDAAVQVTLPLSNGSGVSAALSKTGAGTLTLSGANTFSGGLSVGGGRVQLGSGNGAGSGAVALAASTVLEVATAGTVANAISGDGSLVKSGSATVTLSGANTYAGGTSLSGGVVRVGTPAALGSGPVAIASGASLVVTSSQTLSAADRARISGAGTVLAGAGADVVWGGDYAVGSGLVFDAEAGGTLEVGQLIGSGYTKTLPGKLRIAGTSGYSGEIVVGAGVLEIDSTDILASGVTVRTTGSGAVQLDALDGQNLSKITGTCAVTFRNGAAIAINTDALTVAPTTATNETWSISSLTGSADLIKAGPGTMVVSNAASFAGRVFVLNGLLRAAGAIGNNAVTVSNGVFAAYGAGTVLQNPFTIAGGTLLADAGGSLGAGTISLLSGGTLAATNSGSLGSGPLTLNAGTLRLDAGGTAGTRAIALASGGLIQIYDGAGFNDATLTAGGGTIDFRACTAMGKGVTFTGSTYLSATTPSGAAVQTVALLAGPLSNTGWVKLTAGGSGRLLIAGGGAINYGGELFVVGGGDVTVVSNAFTVTGWAGLESGGKRLAVADGGTFSMTGSGCGFNLGVGSDNVFEVVTGGVFTAASGVNLNIGWTGGTGIFRMSGGEAQIAVGGGACSFGAVDSSGKGRIELNAGVLKTSRKIRNAAGTGVVAFNGGTLASDGANTPDAWIAADVPVTVGSGGGALNAGGLDIALESSGLSGAGALAQTGGGTLRFTQASTNWAGGLTLVAGTAVASASNALGTGTVTLGTNTLNIAASVLLPNTLLAPSAGGVVWVGAGITGSVARVSGGRLIKRGDGALFADDASEGTDLSIQGGQVAVVPVAGVVRTPAGLPAIWMDASVASSFATGSSSDVSRWYDRRTPGDDTGFYASQLYNRPLVVSNALNGLPVLDFGVLGQGGGSGDNRMLAFKQYQTNIRSVFWVIGSRRGGGFLLGDSQVDGSKRHFHRSSGSGSYGGVPSDPLWGGEGQDKGIVRAGETWTNGVSVNGATTGLSGSYDLVSWRLSATDDAANNTPGAVWFASCYAPSDGRLNGGQELAEVLIYTNRLSEADRKATETYLNRKWFPLRSGARLMLGQVSLDAPGAGFVNAYPSPVAIAELVVNSTNVFVSGTAGGTAVAKVTVTAAGALNAAALTALSAAALELQEQATLQAAFDAQGQVTVFTVTGSLTLPQSARVVVTGGIKPPSSVLLIKASGGIVSAGGSTGWTNAGTQSRASNVWVNTAAGEVWLKTPRGTAMFFR